MPSPGITPLTAPRSARPAPASQTFDCSRCGFEGQLLGERLCERCTLTDRQTVLLDDGTGRVRPAPTPLFNLLVAMDVPRSGLPWPARSASQSPPPSDSNSSNCLPPSSRALSATTTTTSL
ncbi:hypothetical protein ACIOG9_24935, partial [Streptomyces sp. NPDC088178]